MGITVLGLILLPLSLIWVANPIRLLQLATIAAIFEAAAALIVGGSFGLQPAMVPGLLFVGYVVAQYALGMRYPGERRVLWALTPLFGLFAYALLSIFVLPQAFEGKVMVWPQRPDLIDPGFVPLTFTAGNITQLLYLAMNVVIATCAALLVTRVKIPYRAVLRAYLIGGYMAVGLAFWQFAYRIAHVPFPSDIIQSNPGWAIVKQSIGPVPRIQGSFSEPAALAFYLSGLFFCCLWLNAKGHRIMRVNLLLGLAILGMLCSTSTTGIITLAAGVPLVTIFAALLGDTAAVGRLMKTMAAILVVGALVIGPVFILKPSLQNSIHEVYVATVSKGDSQSYEQRSQLDAVAVSTVGQTDGLGVGWGSYRASSLIPGLLANAGVFGVVMILWLAWRIGVLVNQAKRHARGHPGEIVLDGFIAALCGQLAAACLSAPTIGSLAFFLQFGCATGVAARMAGEVRAAAARPARAARPAEARLAEVRPAQLRPADPRPAVARRPETHRGRFA
jgi:hypothetical protein